MTAASVAEIPVAVAGRTGRMASALASALATQEGMSVVGRLSNRDASSPSGSASWTLFRTISEVPGHAPVVVDFTHPIATRRLLFESLEVPCGLVIGTSGMGAEERALLHEVAKCRAVVHAANFSRGLLLVTRLVDQLSRELGGDWDAQVLDLHHAAKKDRPSATAHLLADRWREGSGGAAPDIATLRLGDGVSEHTVLAAGPGERIEIAHRVLDRKAFVTSVADSVRFVRHRPPGLYGLEHVYPRSPRSGE